MCGCTHTYGAPHTRSHTHTRAQRAEAHLCTRTSNYDGPGCEIFLDVDAYDAEARRQAGKPGGPQALAALAAAAARVPQPCAAAPGLTVEQLLADPGAPAETSSLEYLAFARRVAARTSVALYLLVNRALVNAGCDCARGIKLGPQKRVDRIVFKTAVNYAGDFSRCRDLARLTVVVDDLAGIAEVVNVLLDSPQLAVVRIKNRFDPKCDTVAKPTARMLCECSPTSCRTTTCSRSTPPTSPRSRESR